MAYVCALEAEEKETNGVGLEIELQLSLVIPCAILKPDNLYRFKNVMLWVFHDQTGDRPLWKILFIVYVILLYIVVWLLNIGMVYSKCYSEYV